MKTLKIYCCQFSPVWEDKSRNFARVSALLRSAAPEPGSLVLLPEMFATGFSMRVEHCRQGEPGTTRDYLSRLARAYQAVLVGGLVTAGAEGKGRNQAMVISPTGELLAEYTKLHTFTPGRESQHYQGGNQVVTFAWQSWIMAPGICYDLRFPELFRTAVRRGVQLFVLIANWPASRIGHWRTLAQARAIENQAYVAAVNRCGSDPHQVYGGQSLVVGPRGDILVEAGEGEEVIQAALDIDALQTYRKEFPVLADMRAPI